MPYVLGVDIGGSQTRATIAHYRPGDHHPTTRPVRLGSRGNPVPSVIFVDESGHVLVGEAAENKGTSQPESVVRGFRQRVGDPVPIALGELRVAPEDVYATLARWVVDRVEEHEGAAPDSVTFTHPANWGDFRVDLVRRALAGVGLADAELLSEPIAAALNYAHTLPAGVDQVIAVYDYGGTTLDISIVKGSGARGFGILGTPNHNERLGGSNFDEMVFRRLAARIGDAFTRNDPTEDDVIEAYSVVRRDCVTAKETLSFRAEASIPVALPGVRATVRLVRPEFEAMIEGSVRETIGAFAQALATAGITADDLTAVLLTGGSSRIPLVARQLEGELDRHVVVDDHPTGAVSCGAALAGAPELIAAETVTNVSHVGADVCADELAIEAPRAAPTQTRGGSHPIAAMWRRPSPRRAAAVPVAVAGVVVALVFTVVVAQTTGLSALISESTSGAPGAADRYTPEVLRGDGPAVGFPFGPAVTVSENAGAADDAPPPALRDSEASPNPMRNLWQPWTRDATPTPIRASSGQQGSTNAGSQGSGSSSNPAPNPAPNPDPTPDPVPDPTPELPPDPTPDPVPVPDPNPDPAPVPDPEPTDPDPADPNPEVPVETPPDEGG